MLRVFIFVESEQTIMSEILIKFNQLDTVQQRELLDFLDFLLAKKKGKINSEKEESNEEEQRRKAATLLLEDYEEDKELTAFTELDTDDFYETK